ncbi:MAG: DUF5076 domain-containing protein [Brevundimonas sp.]|uniref:DUF5076 domain-containing protein n=1 Tax=Brevundimonas sp. TaxID=1871086 RepID=UPI002736B4F6|nr:DUF5076 domain-containing protein [Brevundimonas sp.]MDP3403057.1 DUF5076 domain-containing protein [Brevundimonas sp.]
MSNDRSEFQLTVPDSVASDPEAVELMRLWFSRGEPVMSIMPAFEKPGTYGELLAIAARNIAYVYHVQKGLDEEATYRLILSGLKQSLEGPGYRTVAETQAESAA